MSLTMLQNMVSKKIVVPLERLAQYEQQYPDGMYPTTVQTEKPVTTVGDRFIGYVPDRIAPLYPPNTVLPTATSGIALMRPIDVPELYTLLQRNERDYSHHKLPRKLLWQLNTRHALRQQLAKLAATSSNMSSISAGLMAGYGLVKLGGMTMQGLLPASFLLAGAAGTGQHMYDKIRAQLPLTLADKTRKTEKTVALALKRLVSQRP